METRTSIEIWGERGSKLLPHVLVDTGATFSTISRETAEELGIRAVRNRIFRTVQGTVEMPIGVASLAIDGQETTQEVVILEHGPELIGLLTLEALSLKVDTTTGRLEPAGPLNLLGIFLDRHFGPVRGAFPSGSQPEADGGVPQI